MVTIRIVPDIGILQFILESTTAFEDIRIIRVGVALTKDIQLSETQVVW